jgi:hypothetical protein
MHPTTLLLFEALDALQQAQDAVRQAKPSASCSLREADNKIFSAIVELHLVITVEKNDQSKIQIPRRFPS